MKISARKLIWNSHVELWLHKRTTSNWAPKAPFRGFWPFPIVSHHLKPSKVERKKVWKLPLRLKRCWPVCQSDEENIVKKINNFSVNRKFPACGQQATDGCSLRPRSHKWLWWPTSHRATWCGWGYKHAAKGHWECIICGTYLSNEGMNEMLVLSLVICVGIFQYV
jgi:hypothetical protein